MKTDGSVFIKKDNGLTTNWSKIIDDAFLSFTPENVANKSTNTSLGTSDTLYPSQNAVKSYVDAQVKDLAAVAPIVITQDTSTATFSFNQDPSNRLVTDAEKSYWNAKARDTSLFAKDVSGFINPELVNVNYNSSTRKVTLTGTTSALWRDQDITSLPSGWVSDAHGTATGTWFLSYDGSTGTATWSQTPWSFDKVQIAVVQYQTAYKFGAVETHGLMNWQTHKEFHEAVGAYVSTGGCDFSSYVLASTTAANRRPNISACTVNDEDLPTTNSALTSKTYTQLTLSGSSATGVLTTAAAEIVPVSGNVPFYNQFTGGAWQQTPMTSNQYQAIFVLAIPVTLDAESQAYRYVFVQGQSVSSTLSTIQALTPSSLNMAGLMLQQPEYVFIGKIIIQYVGGGTANWNIVSVEKLTGTKVSQSSISGGNFLSSVSTDANFTGIGTSGDPLKLATDITLSGYTYTGSPTVDGSYRTYVSGGVYITEKRVSGVWTEVSRIE